MNIVLQRNSGFSLVELVLTISLMGVILAIALPSYNFMVDNGRKKAEVSNLIATLTFARDTAMSRNYPVVVCSGLDVDKNDRIITGCINSKVWTKKITTYYEPLKQPDTIRYEHILNNQTMFKNYYWVWSSATKRNYLRFKSNAMTDNQNGTFFLCLDGKAKHKVIVNRAGSIRDDKAKAQDNKDCAI